MAAQLHRDQRQVDSFAALGLALLAAFWSGGSRIESPSVALPLSFRRSVPFREIRLCDVDGAGDFLGVTGAAFGGGSAGGLLAAGAMTGQVEDGGVQAGQRGLRVGRAVSAVPAGGVGGDVGADEGEHFRAVPSVVSGEYLSRGRNVIG